MLLFAPIDVLNDLLLKLGLSHEQITYFVWPLIQIGLIVTLVALWNAYTALALFAALALFYALGSSLLQRG